MGLGRNWMVICQGPWMDLISEHLMQIISNRCVHIAIGFGELQLLVIMIVDYKSDARIPRKNNQSNFMFYIDLLGEE